MVKALLLTVVCLQLAVAVSADDKTVYYRNAKSLGMGDTRVAGGFDYNGFVHNPALLARVKHFRLSIVPIPIMINGDLMDVGKFIDDNQDKFENFEELSVEETNEFLDDIQEFDGKWGRVNASPMVSVAGSIMGNSIGFAMYNTTDVGFKIDRGVYEPRVWGEGYSNTVAVLGFARPLLGLYPGLTVGANVKVLQRSKASLFQIKASELGDAGDTLDPITDELNDKTNSVLLDIGALWDVPIIDTEVGATMVSLGDGRGASVNVGVAKQLMYDHVLLLADVIDITDNNQENFFRKIHAGAQYKYGFLALRGGINSGYPAMGLGLNFKVVDIDAAWFWDELGNAPGVYEDERMLLHIKFGW